jgi:hypothetical protein
VPVCARLGAVACGRCWEAVIRADERVVVEHDLPPVDPVEAATYLDEIAIERACRGERVRLTRAERAETVRRLRARGLGFGAIAHRLRMSDAQVRIVSTGRPGAAGAHGEAA